MYEIWFLYRDDWGKLSFVKRKGFQKKLGTAIKLAKALGHNSYVKKYGSTRPVFVNNNYFDSLLEHTE